MKGTARGDEFRGGAQTAPVWRDDLRTSDPRAIHALVEGTGVFRAAEVTMAADLASEALRRGAASGYHFIFVGAADSLDGYTCYGPIEGSVGSWELYWIAVAPRCQGTGLGRKLLEESARRVAAAGGKRLFIETSSTAPYAAARGLYTGCGWAHVATLPNYYDAGDDQVVYERELSPGGALEVTQAIDRPCRR